MTIPSAYYKIVMDYNQLQAIAFILPHENLPSRDIAKYRLSMRKIE